MVAGGESSMNDREKEIYGRLASQCNNAAPAVLQLAAACAKEIARLEQAVDGVTMAIAGPPPSVDEASVLVSGTVEYTGAPVVSEGSD
jgi:GTP1/Obg family GTP-binding protein